MIIQIGFYSAIMEQPFPEEDFLLALRRSLGYIKSRTQMRAGNSTSWFAVVKDVT